MCNVICIPLMPSTLRFLLIHLHHTFHIIGLFGEFLQHALQNLLIFRLPEVPLPPLRVEDRLARLRPAAVVVEVGVRSASGLLGLLGVRHRGSAGTPRGLHAKERRKELRETGKRSREWGCEGMGKERERKEDTSGGE